jgi:hypothetical protein
LVERRFLPSSICRVSLKQGRDEHYAIHTTLDTFIDLVEHTVSILGYKYLAPFRRSTLEVIRIVEFGLLIYTFELNSSDTNFASKEFTSLHTTELRD